jgi:2,3-diketo-5-methylthio-1-phosphopentane phosphatase
VLKRVHHPVTRASHAGAQTSERADGFNAAPGSLRIVLDFDGTITERDTLELVVEKFGDPTARRETEAGLGAGMSLQEVIARQYATVQAPLEDVVAWAVENVRFRPGFHELMRLARAQGWETAIVSSGVREVIEPLLAREGIEGIPVAANSVDPDPSGWQVLFRDQEACSVCGEPCKRSSVTALAGHGALVYVGDGYSDGCAAGAADYVFARRRLVMYLEERGQRFERFDDFIQVARRLSELTGQPQAPEQDFELERARADTRAARLEMEAHIWRTRAERAEARLAHWQAWEGRASWRIFVRLINLRARAAPPGSARDRAVRSVARRLAGRAERPRAQSTGRNRPQRERAVLIVSGRPGATKRYRCDHRAEQLRMLGASVDVVMLDEVDFEDVVVEYGCFVLHRVPFDGSVGHFVDAAKARGAQVVFDTDDLLFDAVAEPFLPESAQHDNRVSRLRQTMTACHAVTVTTEPLGEKAARLHGRVLVEPNVVSREMVDHAEAALARAGKRGDDRPTIAYLSGTPTHDADFLEAADAVLWALETYPAARFLGVGRLTIDSRFERFGDRVELIGLQPWQLLPEVLAGVDCNLAPLERGNPFSECKSCLKFLEAGLVGVPTIASPRPDFARVIEHERNGLLADSPSEWRTALGFLLESPKRRQELGRAAFEDVRGRHTTEVQAVHARETLRSAGSGRISQLTVNWLAGGANARRLAESLAARENVVVRTYDVGVPRALEPADVSVADLETAELVAEDARSLFKCVWFVDPAPSLPREFLAVCPSSESARELSRRTGRPVEHLGLEGETSPGASWDEAGQAMETVLRRTCFVNLGSRRRAGS